MTDDAAPRGPADSEDFPPELMARDKIEETIAFLRAMPLPWSVKRKKLYFWGKALGVVVDRSYYDRLAPGGVQ